MTFDILDYQPTDRDAIIALSLRAWGPVFPKMRADTPAYIYESFYPHGWEARQSTDIGDVCDDNETTIWIAKSKGSFAGFVGARFHPEDSMGEILVIAVDPDHQRQGIADALMVHAESWMREKGARMTMVETGGDSGHAPARKTYENAGYEQLPIARFFKEL